MAISCDLNAYILDPRRLHQIKKGRVAIYCHAAFFYAPGFAMRFDLIYCAL